MTEPDAQRRSIETTVNGERRVASALAGDRADHVAEVQTAALQLEVAVRPASGHDLLRVPEDLIARHGAVSEAVALAMATGGIESVTARLRLNRVTALLAGAAATSLLALVLVFGGM